MWIPALIWAWLVTATAGETHIWAYAHVMPVAGKPLADFGVIVIYIAPMFFILWAGLRVGLYFWPRALTGLGQRTFVTNK